MKHAPRILAFTGISALVAAAGLAALMMARPPPRRRGARGKFPATFYPVRDAGPENMLHPPADWDRVDEALDGSFPASDPPCHCVRSRYA